MAIRLDHIIVPARDPREGARLLAGLLDVPWATAQGEFTAVYVNESLTLDFAAIFGRIQAAGIKYRSRYWQDTDGHLWEILTVSYARAASAL